MFSNVLLCFFVGKLSFPNAKFFSFVIEDFDNVAFFKIAVDFCNSDKISSHTDFYLDFTPLYLIIMLSVSFGRALPDGTEFFDRNGGG